MAGPGNMRPRGMRSTVENPMGVLMRLLRYVGRRYGGRLIFVVALIIVGVLANVQGTLFMRTLIDDYIAPMLRTPGRPDFGPLGAAIIRVASFYLIGIIANYTYQRIMIGVTQGTLRDLRDELFAHMEGLPVRYFDTHAHGDVMSIYTNDIDTMRQLIGQSIPQLFNSVITIVSVVISMFVLDVPMTLITLGMVGLMLVVTKKVGSQSGKYFVAQQRDLGDLNGYIEEMITGQKVVKVFSHEEAAKEDFRKKNEQLFDSADKAHRFSNILAPINAQLGNLNYVVCAIVGGIFAINHISGLTVGKLASFLTFNRSFSMPINQISMQFNSIVMAIAGADRVFRLLDEEPEVDDGRVTLVRARREGEKLVPITEQTESGAGSGQTGSFGQAESAGQAGCAGQAGSAGQEAAELTWAWCIPEGETAALETDTVIGDRRYRELKGGLVMDQVDFSYIPEKQVLYDISLFAKPGQKIAFVGSTGAGKTTITNLINRFYDIQDGKIRYDGININRVKKADLRRSLGMVLQDVNLFTGTVRENIRFGRLDATDAEVEAAAKLANADGFIRRLPQGYDTVLAGNGSSLSQGQRQLLAIARAAVADPPALILDEATSSIDTRTERIVQSGMDKLMEGRTTFVIAHRLSTVRNANCIMVLEGGRIIERGTHEELMEQQGRYYRLYTGASA